jgi:putative ABC transport system permease protein
MQDLRFAVRALRTQPLFTLVAVLTLTLGIGANTAIFSVVYQVLLRPLPFPEPDRLVFVWNVYGKGGPDLSDVSIPDYLDRRAQAPAIEEATLFRRRDATLLSGDAPEQIVALAVTPSFFSTLRRGPALGRAFVDADAVPGADARVVMLTHALWASRFASDPAIVGRHIRVNGEAREVVGVLAADFELPRRDAVMLMPFAFTPAQMSDQERGNEFSEMIARLRPDATIPQLNAQMSAIVTRLIDRVPARADFMRNTGFSGVAIDMREQITGRTSASLYLLQAGVLLVLAIACANVANLLLMRATGRHRELAIRTSLGASGTRILRHLLVEGAVLSAAGTACGVALAVAAGPALGALLAEQMPRALQASIDPAVLVFTAIVALVTTAVFGVIPAIPVMRGRLARALAEDGARGSAGRRTGAIRTALAAAETALAIMLLVAAGLLARSFVRVTRVDPGFTADGVMTAQMTLPSTRYPDAAARRAFWTTLVERARAMPGVTAAGVVSSLPFGGRPSAGSYTIVGRPIPPGGTPLHAQDDWIWGDYFKAMGIPLVEGRTFDDRDAPDAPRVVIVDRMLAERRFAGESAVGRQLNFGSQRNYTIVGVVGTINAADLAKPVPEERIYFNVVQLTQSAMTLVVKTAADVSTAAPAVRGIVRAIDPEQPIARMQPMRQWIAGSLEGRRAPMLLVVLFGAVALALSAVGLYGVLAFGVAQRAREFGIRQALGADRRSLLSLVLRHGMRTAAAGAIAGLAGSLVLARSLQSMLFGVTARDPAVLAGAAAVLFAVALLACYIPARRAARIDPIVALRDA